MKKSLYALSIITAAILSGCMSFPTELANNATKYCADDSGEFFECKDVTMDKNPTAPENKSTLFSTQYNFQFLSEYTEQLAYDLKRSLQNKKIDRSIIVTTFVFLDPSLRNTDVVGQQVAELLKVQPSDLVADLTCGSGAFFNFMPTSSNVYGCELNSQSVRVANFLYPKSNIVCDDIRNYNPNVQFDSVIINPPFNLRFNDMSSQMYVCQKAAEYCRVAPESPGTGLGVVRG